MVLGADRDQQVWHRWCSSLRGRLWWDSRVVAVLRLSNLMLVTLSSLQPFFFKALVGFQGHGCADVVQPNCCHPFLLEAFLFHWPSIRRCASRTMVEPKVPASKKSAR